LNRTATGGNWSEVGTRAPAGITKRDDNVAAQAVFDESGQPINDPLVR